MANQNVNTSEKEKMNTFKFVVKVNRGGTRGTEYVHKMDCKPIQMTPNRKQALAMGKFAAEEVVKSIQGSRSNPTVMMVAVPA